MSKPCKKSSTIFVESLEKKIWKLYSLPDYLMGSLAVFFIVNFIYLNIYGNFIIDNFENEKAAGLALTFSAFFPILLAFYFLWTSPNHLLTEMNRKIDGNINEVEYYGFLIDSNAKLQRIVSFYKRCIVYIWILILTIPYFNYALTNALYFIWVNFTALMNYLNYNFFSHNPLNLFILNMLEMF